MPTRPTWGPATTHHILWQYAAAVGLKATRSRKDGTWTVTDRCTGALLYGPTRDPKRALLWVMRYVVARLRGVRGPPYGSD
jgi:hypothetical protein